MCYLYYNGDYYPTTTKLFTADNRGFKYGDGVFESMLMHNKKIALLHLHIQRLQRALQCLGMQVPNYLTPTYIANICTVLANKNATVNARIRIAVHRANGGLYTPTNNTICLLITCTPTTSAGFRFPKKGLHMGLYTNIPKIIHPIGNFKTANALLYIMAARYKTQQGYDDCFIINTQHKIVDALSSNVFVRTTDGQWYTPPLSDACVAGVMREYIMQATASFTPPIVTTSISLTLLRNASEVFLTNAVQGIKWVQSFENKKYTAQYTKQLFEQTLAKL